MMRKIFKHKILCAFIFLLIVAVSCVCAHRVCNTVKAERLYDQWQVSLAEPLQRPMFAYSRSEGMEYFVCVTEDGVSACGQRNMLTGEEQIFLDEQEYSFSSASAAPVCRSADTAEAIARIRETILAEVVDFSDTRIVDKSLFELGLFGEEGEPRFILDIKRIVEFELRDPQPEEYAHISLTEDGDSLFVYNVTPESFSTAATCLFLELGLSDAPEGLWQGHDWTQL